MNMEVIRSVSEFDELISELVLKGLFSALEMNT